MWLWQLKEWPTFAYDHKKLVQYETKYLLLTGEIKGKLRTLTDEDTKILVTELLADEAHKTSYIEGERMSQKSLRASIGKHFGLSVTSDGAQPKERGIAQMMLSLYRGIGDRLDDQLMWKWHGMVMTGYERTPDIGRYRDGGMVIGSNKVGDERIFYEAPPHERLEREMGSFVAWYAARLSEKDMQVLAFAGIAHVYFESIHPFSDGNGRIGRALAILALSQSMGDFALLPLSEAIESSRSKYYDALASLNHSLEADHWLKYFCSTVVKAAEKANALLDFIVRKGRFLRDGEKKFNERQMKAVKRMLEEGPDLFKGGLSAEKYMKITGNNSSTTASRDLKELVAWGALTRDGKGKYTRYHLNLGK